MSPPSVTSKTWISQDDADKFKSDLKRPSERTRFHAASLKITKDIHVLSCWSAFFQLAVDRDSFSRLQLPIDKICIY
jgi:hypothetical protein